MEDAVPIISGVTTLIGEGASAFSAFKGSKTPKMPDAPKLTPVSKAPTMGNEDTQAAKKAELLRMSQKSGRESTILTDENLG